MYYAIFQFHAMQNSQIVFKKSGKNPIVSLEEWRHIHYNGRNKGNLPFLKKKGWERNGPDQTKQKTNRVHSGPRAVGGFSGTFRKDPHSGFSPAGRGHGGSPLKVQGHFPKGENTVSTDGSADTETP